MELLSGEIHWLYHLNKYVIVNLIEKQSIIYYWNNMFIM